MGQRANYVVFENGKYRLFYSHWAANTIDRDLFWGPRAALTFIRQQREMSPDDWLDDVWCEGGAVVDLDGRILTFFGGEDVIYEIPLRRLYLRFLSKSWEDWQIRWAHEGIADLADAAGYPRAKVLSKKSLAGRWKPLKSPDDESPSIDAVASVADLSGLRVYPIMAFTVDQVFEDVNFLENLLRMRPRAHFEVHKVKGLPNSGIHLDLSRKMLQIWTASPHPDLGADLRHTWKNWHVEWQHDLYEFQESVTGGAVRLPAYTDQELLPRLTEIVMRDLNQEDPVARFESLTKGLRDAGHDIQVASSTTSWHVDWLPSRKEREQIWAKVLGSLGLA